MSKFVHMELNTSDPEAAQKFYKSVFGWKYQKMKMDDGTVYVGFTGDGDGIGGGISKSQDPNMPPAWLGYVGVDSVKRTIAKVEKSGGKVVVPRMEIPNIGRLAIFTDPQGAVFAVWEPIARPADTTTAEPAAAQQAPEAAPKAKKTAKKAAGKKAAKKEAAAEPAPAAGKKAAKKEAAAEPAPAAGKKKATKKKAAAKK
jgi:predicted enzyme related to lactoylglutathione lyase